MDLHSLNSKDTPLLHVCVLQVGLAEMAELPRSQEAVPGDGHRGPAPLGFQTAEACMSTSLSQDRQFCCALHASFCPPSCHPPSLQCWSSWVGRCSARQLVERQRATAAQHHRGKLLGACWSAWVVYVDHKRKESQMRGL